MLILSALLLAVQEPAPEPRPLPPLHGGPEQTTCPIGGERFEALVTSHYSTMGARPDGRPHTYWYMPLPLPICPSNGLVVFEQFDARQIAALTPLIESEEYRAMSERESSYYRAQWLATRIGFPEADALWMLLSATWQVKPPSGATGQPMPSPEKARQYQQEFVARVRALPAVPADEDYVALFIRAANAERELGHFESAAAMLRQADAWVPNSEENDWQEFVTALSAVVARRDPAVEPLDMAGELRVPWLCIEEGLADTDFNRAICSRPEVQARIEENRRLVEEQPNQ